MKTLIPIPSFLIVPILALACIIGLVPRTQAVSPAPDGGYPGGNTAEGLNALLSLTTGTYNTAVGVFSLESNTTGKFNTAVGAGTLLENTAGDQNTATGAGALLSNTTGAFNTANGTFALFSNTTGDGNTGTGYEALFNNYASSNTAMGYEALLSNRGGSDNSALGWASLASNIDSSQNTAVGSQALQSNTADSNTAVGFQALQSNTEGSENTAVGAQALQRNQDGTGNTATGYESLLFNTSAFNTANGYEALMNTTTGQGNTAIGVQALFNNITGDGNIAIGPTAGGNLYNSSGNIEIGNLGVAGDSETTRIGTSQTKTFIAGIRDVTTGNADAIPVLIDSNGQLGTASSSRRFKKEIQPMDKASESILALKPVTFQYKSDKTSTLQFGLIAEEVEKVNPDLVVRDAQGRIYTVRYDAVNAMLLNEFLKEHRKNEEQEATIGQLKAGMAALTAMVKEQAAQIQKVSAQLSTSKPAPQVAENNQ
jgi:hypothetical protein